MKLSLIFLLFLFLVACSPSDVSYKIIDSPNDATTWFKENCDQCVELQEAYWKPGNFRGVKKFDYDGKTYIVVNSGRKPDSGSYIEINDIKEEGDNLIIEAKDVPSAKNIATLPAESNPKILIITNSIKKNVQVKWE
ncbi:MAG: hypothetical protein K0S39_3236 [Paenibacillus sp.]|jgi:hypothetical protein|nr:hypothetical protein [Paenibacillus sp.]